MARRLHLVAYDVSAPDRLRAVLDAVKTWRAAGQKSVAECWMSAAERAQLCQKLAGLIDPESDRLTVLRLDPRQRARLFGCAVAAPAPLFIMG